VCFCLCVFVSGITGKLVASIVVRQFYVAVFKHHVRELSHINADRDSSCMQDARTWAHACMQMFYFFFNYFFSLYSCMQM
jgi:hypothetical protein